MLPTMRTRSIPLPASQVSRFPTQLSVVLLFVELTVIGIASVLS